MDSFKKIYEKMMGMASVFNDKAAISIDESKMNELKEIIHELYTVAGKYNNSMEELIAVAKSKAIRTEYSTQSKFLHRGYYCPSPIYDLVIGNSRRGELTNNPNATEYYQYNFDSNNAMVSAEQYATIPTGLNAQTIEFIFREGNTEYGLTFDNYAGQYAKKEISYLVKAEYLSGELISYSGCLHNSHISEDMTTLHHEDYFYTEGRLSKADVYINVCPAFNSYDKNVYIFRYDDSGKIYEYDVQSQLRGKLYKDTHAVSKEKYIMRSF